MSVVDFRPHYLAVLVAGEGVIADNGDYIPDTTQKRYGAPIPCVAVPAGKPATITLPDGTTREYSYTVYLDADAPSIEMGTRVRLTLNRDRVEEEREVLGFEANQLGCKLWV